MLKKSIFLSILLLILIVATSNNADAAEAPPQPLTKVSFIPQWVPQAQFAGYYVALETGIYKKYGLDLKIISGGPGRSSSDYLTNRKADFASLWLVSGLKLCSQGVPVVNLAQIVQRSALMLIAKKSSGILKVSDINERRVGLWGAPFETQPQFFIKQNHLKIHPIHQSYSVNLFLRDGVDVTSAMWYNEYHTIINAGINPDELTTFFYADYNLNYPEDGIYVLRETWQQKPEICRAFVEASIEGWQKAFSEPKLALDITMNNLKKEHIITNRAHQKWMLARMQDIILPGHKNHHSLSIGHLKLKDFQKVTNDLRKIDISKKFPDFKTFHPAQISTGAQK